MSKRTVFTTLTPLPAGITRETVLETLSSHDEMIRLNPLVIEHHPINPPPTASAEEYHCSWYSLTDRVQYLPGGLAAGKVSYNVCFHNLPMGVQTHCFAPMGLRIKGKWTLGGSLPGEPVAPIELGLGAPLQGLWLREDVDMKCNVMMTAFVKKTLKSAHAALVDRLVVKASIVDAASQNRKLHAESLRSELPFSSSNPSIRFSSENGYYSPSTSDASSSYSYANNPPLPSYSNDESLYPEALLVGKRSQLAHSGSTPGSHQSRSQLNERSSSGRVLWQDLGQSRSGSTQHASGSRQSSLSFRAELPAEERETAWKSQSEKPYAQPRYGAAELE